MNSTMNQTKLENVDEAAKRLGLKAPRVTMQDLDDNIVDVEFVKHIAKSGQVLRWAVLTLRNGFAHAGDPSASVSAANDSQELGERYALENARRALWPLMGYALKEALAREPVVMFTERGQQVRYPDQTNALAGMSDAEHGRLGHVWDAARDEWRVP